jgi:hypothetical protein
MNSWKMRFSAVIIAMLSCATSFAQTGNYFLSHHAPANELFDNVCFDIAQDKRGVMFFATKAGILQFDGRNWDLLKRKNAVYSIYISGSDEIYWAGTNGFGRIGLDKNGFHQLEYLKDSTNSHVIQTIAVEKTAFFLTEEKLYAYDIPTAKISVTEATKETGAFSRLFELFGVLYINAEHGIFKLHDQKLVHSRLPINEDVAFVSRIDDLYLLGTTGNKIYSCNESLKFSPVVIHDQEYADASVIISGSWINRHLLALGTLRGGVMFINPITGRTQEIINYATGLPDNEVFALLADHNDNVWVAHDYGFTKVSPYMPFRSFNHYKGLEGNLLCAYSARGTAYVGTSLGLFKLEKEDLYEELIYFVDVELPQKTSGKQKRSDPVPNTDTKTPPAETESRRRGLFGFLKKNRDKEKQETTAKSGGQDHSAVAPSSIPNNSAARYTKEKRTKKVLRASQYAYKRVEGIDAKIANLLEVNGRLIASGLGGVYEVTGLRAKPLLKDPVHYLYASVTENILFAATYDDRLRTLVFEKNAWVQVDLLDQIEDRINFIFEGDDRSLWLCGADKLYQYQMTDFNVNPTFEIDISNFAIENTLGISSNGEVLFANTDGFFRFEKSDSSLVKIDSLPAPTQYFAANGSMVYRDPHGWKLMGKINSPANLNLLNLFEDLRYITSDSGGNLWIISGSTGLHKFFAENVTIDHDPFPVFLKSITNKDRKTGFATQIHISEDKSAVTFEIAQADFVSPDAIEFRYMLKGMKEEWSDWSSHNTSIGFPYLPPGDYTLQVQGRNIFGKVTELKPFTFEVLPPYWKRSWFYAMEFAIIASLVLLSFRLNERYRIVSRVLTLLTIILLIQFVQTFVSSVIPFDQENPVVNFIIQVFIALMILPVEGYLRNLMFRSMDPESRFYKFIASKPSARIAQEKTELQPTDEL